MPRENSATRVTRRWLPRLMRWRRSVRASPTWSLPIPSIPKTTPKSVRWSAKTVKRPVESMRTAHRMQGVRRSLCTGRTEHQRDLCLILHTRISPRPRTGQIADLIHNFWTHPWHGRCALICKDDWLKRMEGGLSNSGLLNAASSTAAHPRQHGIVDVQTVSDSNQQLALCSGPSSVWGG